MQNLNFYKQAINLAPRVLSLLDRSEFSYSYGSFDKDYWHFKTKDFSSAGPQMGVEFLALLWSFENSENKYFKNENILKWCRASLLYTLSLQNKDGSFDEWYPNERGWAGPTSYVIHSLFQATSILRDQLSMDDLAKITNCFHNAGKFLILRDEKEFLANHFALYLLSLLEIYEITQDGSFLCVYERDVGLFFSKVTSEGWADEYDGVDFSYALATLNFFVHIHKLRPSLEIERFAQKSYQFLAYFCFPDGSIGAGLGSRNTVHLYPLAPSYWSTYSVEAGAIFDLCYVKKNSEI
jgi:hypothetical protein